MNNALIRHSRVYLEPPACRVPFAAVSIAFENGDASETHIMTAAVERSDASITADSRFVVQSITKSFTAAVILRLVASGKLMLDIPLSEWEKNGDILDFVSRKLAFAPSYSECPPFFFSFLLC